MHTYISMYRSYTCNGIVNVSAYNEISAKWNKQPMGCDPQLAFGGKLSGVFYERGMSGRVCGKIWGGGEFLTGNCPG